MNTLQILLALGAFITTCIIFALPKGKSEGETNPLTFGVISFCLFGIVAIVVAIVFYYLVLKGHESPHGGIIFYLLLFGFLATGIFLLVPTKIGPNEKKTDGKAAEAGADDDKNVLHVATISLLGQPIPHLVVNQGWTLLIKGVMSTSLIKSDWDVLTLMVEMISRDNAPFTCEVSFRYRIKNFYLAIFENGIGTVIKSLEDTVEGCLTGFAGSLEAEVLTRLRQADKIELINNFLGPDLEETADRVGVEVEAVSKAGKVVLRVDDFVCTDPEFKTALLLGAVTRRSMQAVNTKTDEFIKLYHRFFALYNAYMPPAAAAEAARNDAKVQIGAAEERIFKGLGGSSIVETGEGVATGTQGKGNRKGKGKK